MLIFAIFCFSLFFSLGQAGCPVLYNGVCRPESENIIQLHTFKKPLAPPFDVVADKVSPAADLSVTNPNPTRFQWLADLPGGDPDSGLDGVQLFNDVADGTQNNTRTILYGSPAKLIADAKASNAFAIEMWVKPAQLTTPNYARLFSIAWGTTPCTTLGVTAMQQNFQIAQNNQRLEMRLKSTDLGASPNYCNRRMDGVFNDTSKWMHLVFSYNGATNGTIRIFRDGVVPVNGVRSSINASGVNLSNWRDLAGLGVGGPVACPADVCGVLGGNTRYFQGRIRFVAFYKTFLSQATVTVLANQKDPSLMTAFADLTTTGMSTAPPTTTTTTTGGGGGGGTTGASDPNNPSGNPCVQTEPADLTTFTRMGIHLQVELPLFNCNQFKTDLRQKLALASENQIIIWRLLSGSTVIDLVLTDLTAASRVTDLGTQLENGDDMAPLTGVISITDANGRTFLAPTSGGFPLIIVIAAVVGAVVLIALIILLICCLKWRNNQKRQYISGTGQASEPYVPLTTGPLSSSGPSTLRPRGDTEMYETFDNYAANQASPDEVIPLNVMQDVIDRGEGILSAKRGDIAYAARIDYEGTSNEWIWVKIGQKEGYVPTAYCRPRAQIK